MLKSRSRDRLEELPAIAFGSCPAKTYQPGDGRIQAGRTVPEHCVIVGEVARELVARYPDELRDALFPACSPLAAASHDIGKVSPCFYEKLNRYLALIRSILRRACHEWEWIDKVPKVRMGKEPEGRVRAQTPPEFQRLVAELPVHLADMAVFAVATGQA